VESREKVNQLFLELASQSRLDILRELETKKLKMRELARRLDLTATEAFRQLKRLTDASLVQRQPAGSYTIAPFGKLVLQLSASFEFVFQHKEYFLTHDLSPIPNPFVNRLGELSRSTLSMEAIRNLNQGEDALGQAAQFLWAMIEGPAKDRLTPTVAERVRQGVKFRFLVPDHYLLQVSIPHDLTQAIEGRGLTVLPATITVSEKEAFVAFNNLGGRADYAGFIAKDQDSINWAKDLFLYYWDKGKRSTASTRT
jgi:predicted transcriptional regulator